MGDRLARREAPRGFPELRCLKLTVDPAGEDVNHRRAWLQALGPHRPYGVCSNISSGIHCSN
jgi:hypothetical protein